MFEQEKLELLAEMAHTVVDCEVGSFFNILAYAGDILLTSSAWMGYKCLLNMANGNALADKKDTVCNFFNNVCMVFPR